MTTHTIETIGHAAQGHVLDRLVRLGVAIAGWPVGRRTAPAAYRIVPGVAVTHDRILAATAGDYSPPERLLTHGTSERWAWDSTSPGVLARQR